MSEQARASLWATAFRARTVLLRLLARWRWSKRGAAGLKAHGKLRRLPAGPDAKNRGHF